MRRRPPASIILSSILLAMGGSSHVMADSSIASIDARIAGVEQPASENGQFEILASNGRVYTVDASQRALIESLRQKLRSHAPLHLQIKEDEEIVGFTELSPAESKTYSDPVGPLTAEQFEAGEGMTGASESMRVDSSGVPAAMQEARRMGFQPTVLSSMDEAWALFRSARTDLDDDSQCHNRALVWSYEWARTQNVRSMKVMMFFTRKFQNTYPRKTVLGIKPYKWWYHTAPYVYVGNQEIVLDRQFLKRPVTLDQWSHYFLSEIIDRSTFVLRETLERNGTRVRSDNAIIGGCFLDPDCLVRMDGKPVYMAERLTPAQTVCKVLTNYREADSYAVQGNEWCAVRKLPMYYYQPETFQRFDCDPTRDPAPKRPATRLRDGRLKFPCLHQELRGFDYDAVKRAYENAVIKRD